MHDGATIKGCGSPKYAKRDFFSKEQMVYIYDGSFEGLLCCIFTSYTQREPIVEIVDNWQPSLYPTREIITDLAAAQRVYLSLEKKLGLSGQKLITTVFLSNMENKAHLIYQFVVKGYGCGAQVCNMLGDPIVMEMAQGKDTVLVAVMETKNQVLPLIANHFCNRFLEENFIIFDKGSKQALTYFNHKPEIIQMENLILDKVDGEEAGYRKLWKEYYKNVAIKERYNPTCRRNFMPKHYWKYITEMEDQVEVIIKEDRCYSEEQNDLI